MAHEISTYDNLFSVREMPWHGLGAVLSEYPRDWEHARQLSGLTWEPVKASAFRRVIEMSDTGPVERYEEVPQYSWIERDDNGFILANMPDTFELFLNRDLGPLVETLLEASDGELQYETMGSLKNGAQVWVLVRTKEPFVVPGDPNGATLPFLAIQNSHDGSGALRVQRLQTRIVCANTSAAADREADRHGAMYTFRHTAKIYERVEQAKQMIHGLRTDRQAYLDWAADLMSIKLAPRQVDAFIENFIPMPVADVITDRVRNNIDEARGTFRSILTSATSEGIETNAYGVTHAAIEFLDHGRAARTAETKFRRCVLATDGLKRQAERFARQAALV